jgi:hypothetical protein
LSAAKLAAVALTIALCGTLAGSAAAAPQGGAKTGVTIHAGKTSVWGAVKSARDGCAAGRKVVVFKRRGGAPDRRIGSDRSAAGDAGHQWSVRRTGTGLFYARAAATKGCAAGRSETIGIALPSAAPAAGERTDYPICGPYVSEGTTEVCRFDQLHLSLLPAGGPGCQYFAEASGSCGGGTTAGLFPWGETGFASRPGVAFVWSQAGDRRSIRLTSFGEASSVGTATIYGTVPGSGSPRLSVEDAYARSSLPYPAGDHFYTPDLPGQAAGEPGGPLAINFQAGPQGVGGQVDIIGYLYLKR